ncbi:hypothetical protein DH86_00000845, partial [Scytalidium sp. 3C]
AEKRNPPRKGHKKSRRGCYNCKRRKVKCQETFPECTNCIRNRLECVYPPPKPPSIQEQLALREDGLFPTVQLQPSPVQFSLTDMRFFHHFLMRAHPHLPINCERAWICQIPLIAHQALTITPQQYRIEYSQSKVRTKPLKKALKAEQMQMLLWLAVMRLPFNLPT